ncbi:TPA: hypothetical protein ACH3X3_010824 [Trebouxia sp. C0006]
MYMWAEPPINDSCSAVRYGAGLAYAPHSIQLIDPSVTLYTSNGSNALDFLLWVTDIAGQNVTAGVSTDLASVSGLEVIVNVSALSLPANATPLRPTCSTTSTANSSGVIPASAFGCAWGL